MNITWLQFTIKNSLLYDATKHEDYSNGIMLLERWVMESRGAEQPTYTGHASAPLRQVQRVGDNV